MDQNTLQTTFNIDSSKAANADTLAATARESVRNPGTARVNPDTIGGKEFNANPDGTIVTNPATATADRYLREAQQVTDLINSKYASKISGDKETIADMDSRARVLNERRGVTGSGTGESAVIQNKQKGDKVIAADEAAKTTEISAALGRIDQARSNEMKADAAQARNDLVTAQNLRAKNKTESEATIKSLATSGVDLDTLKTKEPESYDHLLKATGLSPIELEAYYNNQKDVANQTKWQYKVSGDTVTAYGVDSKGQLKTQDQTVPGLSTGNYQIIKGDNGVLYKINKDSNEVTPLVNAAKTTSTTPPKQTITLNDAQKKNLVGTGLSGADIKNLQNDLNKASIDDVLAGFADPKQKAAVKAAILNSTSSKAATPGA